MILLDVVFNRGAGRILDDGETKNSYIFLLIAQMFF